MGVDISLALDYCSHAGEVPETWVPLSGTYYWLQGSGVMYNQWDCLQTMKFSTGLLTQTGVMSKMGPH